MGEHEEFLFMRCAVGSDRPSLVVSMSSDRNIDDVIEEFRVFLLAGGFHPQTVEDRLPAP